MKKITAIIVDDEPNNIENLQHLLERWCPDVQVVATAENNNEARTAIDAQRPDLLFLDIQMPGGSGLDLLRSLPTIHFEVIFVTAFDQYGIEAVKLSALDYLVKPLDIPELQQAVSKARIRIAEKKENIKPGNEAPRIALPTIQQTHYVRLDEIVRCESSNNYTTFFLTTQESILVCKTIKEFTEVLRPYRFYRSHQSHLVNAAHVKSLLKTDGGQLLMDDGSKVPVSRQHMETIKKALSGITLLLAFILCFVKSSAVPLENKTVTITGKVINTVSTTPKTAAVCFSNPLRDYRKSVGIDDKGGFSAQEQMIFTQNMTVAYGRYFINLYVQPGDSVHITIDAARLSEPDFAWLTISGDHSTISSQLNRCYNALAGNMPKFDHKVAPENMLEQIKEAYRQKLAVLSAYAREHHLDSIVTQWVACDYKYVLFNYISDYISEAGTAEEKKRIWLYADSFFHITDPTNFQSMYFPIHLGGYAYLLTKNNPSRAIETLLQQPAGICRDFMIYRRLANDIDASPKIIDSLKDLSSYFSDPLFASELHALADRMLHPSFPATIISGIRYLQQNQQPISLKPTDVFQLLAASYPGKVLYIDIYATWCGPCMEEMHYADSIHRKLDNKSLVFINLCLQSDEAKWIPTINKMHIAGENYYLDGDASKLFTGTYLLPGYPTYMLVDKKGKLVNIRALRPSTGDRLIAQINELL